MHSTPLADKFYRIRQMAARDFRRSNQQGLRSGPLYGKIVGGRG